MERWDGGEREQEKREEHSTEQTDPRKPGGLGVESSVARAQRVKTSTARGRAESWTTQSCYRYLFKINGRCLKVLSRGGTWSVAQIDEISN